jgi:glycosyltransferase involved in cell wall biosynthesis
MLKTIGLCMIVKDEAQIMLRCLDSVRSLIDYVLIVDTGSSDETRAIVRQYLSQKRILGEVLDEPWRDFAHNRSFALAKLREHSEIDYALVMDADDTLAFSDGFDAAKFKTSLDKDIYNVEFHMGPTRFWRGQIFSNRLEFSYKGVLYEFVMAPPTISSCGTISDFHI